MTHLSFHICNINSKMYPKIMLRKFFQIVFWGTDKKSLNIYTATVLSGCKECNDINNYKSFSTNAETKDNAKSFEIMFKLDVHNEDENNINFDIKDCSNDLLKQMGNIKKVWGDQCSEITIQEEVNEKLKVIYGDNISIDTSLTAVHLDNNPIFIDDKNKPTRHLFQSIAYKGTVKTEGVSNKYAIATPKDTLHPGFELVNWTKITVSFKKRIPDSDFTYSIELDNNDTTFFVPDFTLYFAPPTMSEIDYSKATVSLSKANKQLNMISPVANKTTIYFTEWVKNEKIGSRNKCRLLRVLPNTIENKQNISINFDITRTKQKIILQFLSAILASSFIAFGIDYTRVESCIGMFPFQKIIPPDIAWLIYIILFFFTLTMQQPEDFNKVSRKMKFLIGARYLGILISFIWFVLVFWLNKISPNCYYSDWSPFIYGASVLLNLIYCVGLYKKYRYELFSWLF